MSVQQKPRDASRSTGRAEVASDPANEELSVLRFLRRLPMQSRSRALVDALVSAFDDALRKVSDEDGLTLDAVARRAGVGVGSFYEYFANKDGLVGMLVERATRDNFRDLLARLDACAEGDVEARFRLVARSVAETYLLAPARTRTMIAGIQRLGLAHAIGRERDRFAAELAARLQRDLPGEERAALEATMRLVADASMGIVVSELYRNRPIDLDAVAAEVCRLGLAITRSRHRFPSPAEPSAEPPGRS